MSVEVIYGPYLKGAEKYIFENIKNNIDNGRNVLYIVPEQAAFVADKLVLETLGEKYSHLTQTINFKRMAHLVNKEYSPQKTEFITEEIKDLILFNILKENASFLKSVKRRKNSPDSMLIFKDIISELKVHLIGSDSLETISKNIEDNPFLSDKISDLKLIIQKYDEYLMNVFNEYEDSFCTLSKNIAEYGIYKDYEIYVDGFVHFSPSEALVVRALMKNCANIRFTCLLDNLSPKQKGDLFYISYETTEKLKKYASDCGQNFSAFFADSNDDNKMLDVFLGESKAVSENIIAVECVNPRDEVRNIVYEIKKLTAAGYKYNDISVLCSDINIYSPYIERLFKSSGILYFMDKKIPLSKNPVCGFFVAALNAVSSIWNWEEVCIYVKSILFMEKIFDSVNVFENYICNFRIKKDMFCNKEKWQETYDIAKLKNKFLLTREKSVNFVYDFLIVPLNKSFSVLKKKNKACVYTQCFNSFIKEISFEKKLRVYIESLADFNDKQIYTNAYNTFLSGIKNIEKLCNDKELTLDEYILLINEVLTVYKTGALPNTLDAVSVSDLERGRVPDKKAVFIPGFNDGVTPKNTTDGSFLSDIEREEIERITNIFLPTSGWKNTSSYLALYRGFISASQKLYASKSAYTMSADENPPSFMWNNIFAAAKEKKFFNKKFVNKAEATDFLIESRLNPFEEKKDTDALLEKVKSSYSNLIEDVKKGEEEGFFDPQKKVDKSIIESLYQKKLNTSVSRLETYRKCAYSYFLSYLLNVSAPDTPDYDFAKTGTIVHDVLNEFSSQYADCEEKWENIKEESLNDVIGDIVRKEIIRQFPKSNIFSPKTKYLIKKLTRISKTAVLYIREHYINGMFTPIGYEIPIDSQGLQPLSFSLSDGSIMEIYGRIDRADMFRAPDDTVYVRIIDYKSSAKDVDFALVKEGIRIQLFVYLQTLVKNGQAYLDLENALLPGAAFYMAYDHSLQRFEKKPAPQETVGRLKEKFKLTGIMLNDESVLYAIDKELKDSSSYKSDVAEVSTDKSGKINIKNLLYKEQFNVLLGDCENTLKKAGNAILDGEFFIQPYKMGEKTACDYCIYKGVCQFDKTMYSYKQVCTLGKEDYFGGGKE